MGSMTPAEELAEGISPLTKRRRKQWCYECQTNTLVHRYPTDLLEEVIDLCDRCAKETA